MTSSSSSPAVIGSLTHELPKMPLTNAVSEKGSTSQCCFWARYSSTVSSICDIRATSARRHLLMLREQSKELPN